MVDRRKILDIKELLKSDFECTQIDDNINKLEVKIVGPKETIYENYSWLISIELPPDYPFKSPSVWFITKIYHPNVDFRSGTICLDVINQEWTPMYNLMNIVDIFIPQLLTYPNPSDPLNIEAAQLMENDIEDFKKKVNENNAKYSLK